MDPSFFNHASSVNASGEFYGIGGNQIIHNYNYYPVPDQDPPRIGNPSHDRPTDITHRSPIVNPEDAIQSRSAVLANLPYATGGPNDISRLITQIISLIDHEQTSCAYDVLKPELELLEQTLVATGLGIQAFRHTQIGHHLVATINPILSRCILVLQDLFETIDTYRQNFWLTSIYSLWHRVWHWGQVDQLASWRKKLFECRSSLGKVVMALHSVEWAQLGNELLTGSVLKDFLQSVKWSTRSLHGIPTCNVQVMNHLGEDILVPTMFCSTWSSFHFIINAYCKNRPGTHYVENGEYQVIHARDNSVIGPSTFNTVEAGMRLEISIILRKRTTHQVTQGKCPRCSRLNSLATATAGWIDCWGCPALFSVVQVDKDDEGRTGIGHSSADAVAEKENQRDPDGVQRPTSPASGPRSNIIWKLARDNETQKFLRISVFNSYQTQSSDLQVNPLLEPPNDDARNDFLQWNMLWRSRSCRCTRDDRHTAWTKGRDESATQPRLPSLRIISEYFPGSINVAAADKSIGVTCGEIIDKIDEHLQRAISKEEYQSLHVVQQSRIAKAYYRNRELGNVNARPSLHWGMIGVDRLCERTIYGGIRRDDRYVKKLFGDVLPGVLVLDCAHSFMTTEEEWLHIEARQTEQERLHRRRSIQQDEDKSDEEKQ